MSKASGQYQGRNDMGSEKEGFGSKLRPTVVKDVSEQKNCATVGKCRYMYKQ